MYIVQLTNLIKENRKLINSQKHYKWKTNTLIKQGKSKVKTFLRKTNKKKLSKMKN